MEFKTVMKKLQLLEKISMLIKSKFKLKKNQTKTMRKR